MQIIPITDIVGAAFVLISIIGQYSYKGKIQSARALRITSVLMLIWLNIDAMAYLMNGQMYPKSLLWIINLLSFIMGSIVIISFINYCYIYTSEYTQVSMALYVIPTIGLIISILVIIFRYITGCIVIFDQGTAIVVGGIPLGIQILNMIWLTYIPIVAYTKRDVIGTRAVVFLAVYCLGPLLAIVVAIITGMDFTAIFAAISIVIVTELLQKEETRKILESTNNDLEHTNKRLNSLNEEFLAQLEEISSLNKQLDKQLDMIRSMNKIYYSSYYVNIPEDTFIIINTIDTMKNTINNNFNAQESFHNICDSLVVSDNVQEIKEFLTLSTLSERMGDKDVITFDYIGKTTGWSQVYIIAGDRDDEGNLITAFVANRTIHEEKNREEEARRRIEEARIEAENANAAKTTFLNNMSHDIRTPMNAILGYASLMKKNDDPALLEDYLNKIEASGEYLLEIINNILEVSRIDSGRVVVEESFTDLMDDKNSVAPLLQNDFEQKHLNFTRDMDIQHRYVFADMNKIREIVMNIMSNAIKYTPEGGNIHMSFNEEDCDVPGYGKYIFEISDDGVGMSAEYVKTIFEPFTREKNTTESKIIGTGLGMSIVKKLVDLMGGTIEVESQLGQGTCFRVILTHKIVDNPEDYLFEEKDHIQKNISFEGRRILLAEDNELNAEIAIAILADAGFEIDLAKDGIECFDMLMNAQENYYDLILMDIQMPNLDGYKTTMKIRKSQEPWQADIPIVAMTANAFEEDKKLAFEAGMDGHIAKPIIVDDLFATLGEILQ